VVVAAKPYLQAVEGHFKQAIEKYRID